MTSEYDFYVKEESQKDGTESSNESDFQMELEEIDEEILEKQEEWLVDPDFLIYQHNINNDPDHIIRYC